MLPLLAAAGRVRMFVKAVLWTAFFSVHFNISIMLPLLPFAPVSVVDCSDQPTGG